MGASAWRPSTHAEHDGCFQPPWSSSSSPSAASALLLSTLQFRTTAVDGAAAALYVSNYRFALTATDYFAADAPPSPLLHFWSLGVEEQFYLFWPLLMLVGLRLVGARRIWIVIAAIAIVSFAGSIVVTSTEPAWAFYSLPTRAWQIALGSFIAALFAMRSVAAPGHGGHLARSGRAGAHRGRRLGDQLHHGVSGLVGGSAGSRSGDADRCRRAANGRVEPRSRLPGPAVVRPHLVLAVPVALADARHHPRGSRAGGTPDSPRSRGHRRWDRRAEHALRREPLPVRARAC